MTTRKRIVVTTRGPDGSNWPVVAWLSVPHTPVRDEIQVLVHGATYDHRYWDWPMEPERYSYVEWANEQRIPTLMIDRPGSGESVHPPGDLLNLYDEAAALHQVIEFVRGGGLGRTFERIIPFGHSMGTAVSGLEAAWFHDVDAVVLTGSLTIESGIANFDPRSVEHFLPAKSVSSLAHVHHLVDDGYITIKPDARMATFYYAPTTDPRLVEFDEEIKGTMTRGEMERIGSASDAAIGITAPALLVVGQFDWIFYDAATHPDVSANVARSKAWSPDNFTYLVVPDAGHNLNLHTNARATYDLMEEWVSALV